MIGSLLSSYAPTAPPKTPSNWPTLVVLAPATPIR
jgi:hypothetical protein